MSKFVSVDKLLYFKQKLESLFTLKTNAIQTAIDNEILARQTADNALDAEITDIRVGYDGTTYDSAGNAVRTQVSELKSDLSNKITKFYASNQGETHITDSDNGKIQDMMIYGKSSQDGTPTPDNPIEIKSVVNPKLKVCGKNLLNLQDYTETINGVTCTIKNGVITLKGTSTGTIFFNFRNIVYITSGETYIFSTNKVENASINLVSKLSEWEKEPTFLNSVNIPKKINESSLLNLQIYISKSGVDFDNSFTPQLEKGSTATQFEPYQGNQATLPYTLNAIPVSSGGNVTIDGQQYIADYVDIDKKQLVRNILYKIFTSKSGFEKNTGSLNQEDRFTYPTENIKSHIIMSNYTNVIDNWGTKSNAIGNGELGTISNRFFIRIQDVTSLNELNTKLSNSPLHILFALAIPTIINLTDEDVQAFKSLTTYYPTTNISVNSEQLDGYTTFNYPISMQNGWNYVKQQLNDNRDYIYDMDTQSAEAYVNSEYAVALTELEV